MIGLQRPPPQWYIFNLSIEYYVSELILRILLREFDLDGLVVEIKDFDYEAIDVEEVAHLIRILSIQILKIVWKLNPSPPFCWLLFVCKHR